MIIYRGEDKKIELTILDADCVAVDLSTVAGYSIVIYQKGIEISKYNEPAQAGFDPITVVDSLNGIVEINLQSAQTILGKVNKELFLAIKIQTVQASFDDGTFDTIIEDIELGKLENARTKLFNP